MTVWLNEQEPCSVVHKVTSLAIAAVSLGPTTHLMIQWFHYSMWLSATGTIPIWPFIRNKHLQGYEETYCRTNMLRSAALWVEVWQPQRDGARVNVLHDFLCLKGSGQDSEMTKHHRKGRYKQGNPSGNFLYGFDSIWKYTSIHTHAQIVQSFTHVTTVQFTPSANNVAKLK